MTLVTRYKVEYFSPFSFEVAALFEPPGASVEQSAIIHYFMQFRPRAVRLAGSLSRFVVKQAYLLL